jgi:nicotinamide mononucleotide adenylyltransferase
VPDPARVGVIHGRFQPLHAGHLEYLLAGMARCDLLVVGITNPDPGTTVYEASDPARGEAAANPCTFYERLVMVESALSESGIARERFRIVPFPHGQPELLAHYAPRDAVYFLTIYDAWGETKLRRLQQLGLRTDVLWRRETKVTSGTELRERIAQRRPWEHLVPPSVAAVIRRFGIDARLERAHEVGV